MRGLIAWFVHNPVTANLLMAFVVVAGLLALGPLEREVLPTARADAATIVVLYPGAGPAEVEEGICAPIEEAVQGVETTELTAVVARLRASAVRTAPVPAAARSEPSMTARAISVRTGRARKTTRIPART